MNIHLLLILLLLVAPARANILIPCGMYDATGQLTDRLFDATWQQCQDWATQTGSTPIIAIEGENAQDFVDNGGEVGAGTTIGIDPTDIVYVFTWGMGAVLMPWGIGFTIGTAKRVVRKA